MRKLVFKLTVMFILGLSVLHSFALDQVDGVYQIATSQDWVDFTELVQADNTVDAVMTADIELDPGVNAQVGNYGNGLHYAGTFDGQGHTLTVHYDLTTAYTAPFHSVSGVVKNLKVAGTMNGTNSFLCGVVGVLVNGYVYNCVSAAHMTGTKTGDSGHGGIVGAVRGSGAVLNSAFVGTIDAPGATHCGGIVGWTVDKHTTLIKNCYTIGTMNVGGNSSFTIARNPACIHLSNVYYLNEVGNLNNQGEVKLTADQAASGELCYMLNLPHDDTQWYQQLGVDAYPVPFKKEGARVYAKADVNCSGRYEGTTEFTNEPQTKPAHTFVNGICTQCAAIQFDYKTPATDGFYELSSAEDLVWFSALSYHGYFEYAKVRLTADIDMSGVTDFRPIAGCDEGFRFRGTFDGQFHTISNLVVELGNNFVGLFGTIGDGADIKNFRLDNTCKLSGAKNVGLVGGIRGPGAVSLTNLGNEGEVIATTSAAGAILGCTEGSFAVPTLDHCYSTGRLNGTYESAALSGWLKNGSIKNSWSIAEIVGFEDAANKHAALGRNDKGSIINSYTFYDGQGTLIEDSAMIGSGELCFLINEGEKANGWFQTLGEDAHPLPFRNHGTVYRNGALRCDGTPLGDGEVTYSNSQTSTIPDHQYVDGFCTVCGGIQPDYLQEADGFYQISNAQQLSWFSQAVSVFGNTNWNARLTANIDLSGFEDKFTPIGNSTHPYVGTFDGQFHTISNLFVEQENDYVGFFGLLNGGATIMNLVLDETCYVKGNIGVGLVGASKVAGTVLLKNLGMEGYVEAITKNAGGILGANTGSASSIVMENCYVTGLVSGNNECGSISGWLGSNGAKVTNCWTSGDLYGMQSEDKYAFRHDNAILTNCYSVNGTQGIIIPLEAVFDGSLCYKLNGDQSNIVWKQNLDNGQQVDEYPVLYPNHGTVYAQAEYLCDGSYNADDAIYTNSADITIPDHSFVDGFCKNCGTEDQHYDKFIKVIQNPDYDQAGNWKELGTAAQIRDGVAEHWNQGYFDTYQDIAGLQKGVYKLRVQGYQRASAWSNAEYYGDGVLNPEHKALQHNSHFYAESDSLKVASLFMDIAEGRQESPILGTNEPYNEVSGCYVPDAMATAHAYFRKGIYWNKPLYLAVTADTLRIGVHNNMYVNGNWTVWDTWRLEYVGDDAAAYALIKEQQLAEIQNLEQLQAQASLVEAYEKAELSLAEATSAEDILAAADKLSRLPEQIRLSHLAYKAYETGIQELVAFREANPDLEGEEVDVFDIYLQDYLEPDETYPNGSFPYIMDECPLNAEELAQELSFAISLREKAVRGSIKEGTDISTLLVNPGFDEDTSFGGWTTEVTKTGSAGSNFNSNSGFTDIYPVAGTWNTEFYVEQEVTGLPNGIYELETQAFYRPGGNLEGELESVVPADLYLNDYFTPVKNIYEGALSPEDAINGVNCRIDPENDPTAPHNGEYLTSYDYLSDYGYVPEQRQAVSFAFAGGRYTNKVYGVVTDGILRIGIRNTGKPWYESGMTMWGRFKVTYRAQNEEVMEEIFNQYQQRIDLLSIQRDVQYYFFAAENVDKVNALIQEGKSAATAAEKLDCIRRINEAFQKIRDSYDLYKKFEEIQEHVILLADYARPETQEALYAIYDELAEVIPTGTWSDEYALERYNEYMTENRYVGGVIWVQGDLVDEEAFDGNWVYSNNLCTFYPLYKNDEGKWEGTVKLQDRSNRVNADSRAGFYFRHMNETYKSFYSSRNFVTPGNTVFATAKNAGKDFQAVGGTLKVLLDIDLETGEGTAEFEAIDYKWSNQVYVAGTVYDKNGMQHRYQNDEAVPLQHVGNGKYTGVVNFYNDTSYPGYGTFTIVAPRATDEPVNYSTVKRSGWNEGRYGSQEDAVILANGVRTDSLIIGNDRKWRVSPQGEYLVEFDMSGAAVTITLLETQGNGTAEAPYILAKKEDVQAMQDRLVSAQTTYFKLAADIDMEGTGWWPLNHTTFGNAEETGTKYVSLDGNSHLIQNFSPSAVADVNAFFGTLAGEVKNVGFWNARSYEAANGNAVLAATLGNPLYEGTTLVQNSYFTGNVDGNAFAGGLAANVEGSVSVSDIYANVNVTSSAEASTVGGLLGRVNGTLALSNSYAAGVVTGTEAGGIIGSETEQASASYTNVIVWNTDVSTTFTDKFCNTTDNAVKNGILYADGTNHAALCQTVAAWQAWNDNGTIGNGYPILNWQVQRADYETYCGFGSSATDIELPVTGQQLYAGFDAEEPVTVYSPSGQIIYKGAAKDFHATAGLYVIKGTVATKKVMLK